jgi:hypothetical protein
MKVGSKAQILYFFLMAGICQLFDIPALTVLTPDSRIFRCASGALAQFFVNCFYSGDKSTPNDPMSRRNCPKVQLQIAMMAKKCPFLAEFVKYAPLGGILTLKIG